MSVGNAPAPIRASRPLELALLFTLAMHAVAMATMALFLLPGMPGGLVDAGARTAYVAAHPWRWRVGWFGWQLAALSDLLLAVALVGTRWIPRLPAWFALLATLAALGPDQISQVGWMTEGVALARRGIEEGALDRYLRFEATAYFRIAGLATIGYLLGALGWTWSLAAAGTWSPRLTRWSIAAWTTFGLATAVLFVPEAVRPPPIVVSIGNAVGFLLLMIWLVEAGERVFARSRPVLAHGRCAPWRHPARGVVGRVMTALGNSHVARASCERIPVVSFASDVTDVVYVSYVVAAERVEHLVPQGLALQRLGPAGRFALFTILTYRHGHFGPRFLGPLRRLLPSPLQSNWRIHVVDPRTDLRGVYFVTTAIGSSAHALAARMLSEGMPMHVPARSALRRDAHGGVHVLLDPGAGTAPDLEATLEPTSDRALPPDFARCFDGYGGFLAYCVPQDRQLTSQPWYRRITRQEIRLGIPLDACEPLTGRVTSVAARAIVGDAEPVCFRVAKVAFELVGEEHEPRD